MTVQRLQATHGNPMSKNKHAKKSSPVSLFVFNGGGQIKMLQAISDVTIEQTIWGSCLMLVAKVHAVLQNIHGSTIRLRAPLSRDDSTGDQSLAMMEDVAATDIVHNAVGAARSLLLRRMAKDEVGPGSCLFRLVCDGDAHWLTILGLK